MSQIDVLFQRLRAEKRKALMPFLTAGRPSLTGTLAALREFEARGCAMAEVGFPYSDPIADGPIIQSSYTHALSSGVKTEQIFDIAKEFCGTTSTPSPAKMPLVGMVSYSIIYKMGLPRFIDTAKTSGFAGAIVPDLLVEEAGPLRAICRAADFSLIHLTTPTTPRERAIQIAESSSGFLYYVSIAGITGERGAIPAELADNVTWLRARTSLPICIGFGISTAEHVASLAPVADGLIVGSAIVRRMESIDPHNLRTGIGELGNFVETLVKATQ